jgi:hypothetical protein
MAPLDQDYVEEGVEAIRRAKAHILLDSIHRKAKKAGLDKLTMKEINEIIAEARRETKVKSKAS